MKKLTGLCLLSLFAIAPQSQACTDFRVVAKDGTVLITRSMEFAMPFNSNLRSSTRGREFSTVASDGKPGMHWQSKYGYAYLDGLGADFAVDGMNEMGLSYEALYLPVIGEYQSVPDGKDAQALPYIFLGDWILGNFQSVDEVRAAVQNIFVFAQKIPGLGDMIFPLHFSVYEPSGKGIVVEFVNGERQIYDSIGVMTNSPSYAWHVMNMNNYIHLSPDNPQPVLANGVTYAATGQGYGMVGLPGDISPPSRFVKTAVLMKTVLQPNTAADAVNVAEHVINNVDIPIGLAREPNGQYTNDYTQWVVFKDLTHKVFTYRTYNNLTLRSVKLDQIDFSEKAARLKMPIDGGPFVIDLTEKWKTSPSN